MFGIFNRFFSSRQLDFYLDVMSNGETSFNVAVTLDEYMEYYRTCTPVATAIDMIATKIASIKPYAIKDGLYLTKNPFLELLKKPNNNQTHFHFINEAIQHYSSCGNNFILAKSDKSGNLISLENINPRRISFSESEIRTEQLYPTRIKIKNINGIEDIYEYKIKRGEVGYYLDNNELFIYKTPSDPNGIIPFSFFLGKSPLTSMEKEILLYNDANIHNKSGMEKALTADKIISLDKDSGLSFNTDEQRKKLQEELKTQFSGAKNSGKIIVSLLGLKILDVKNPFVAKDMDFSSQKMNSELQIYKKFEIPLPLVNSITSNSQNILEEATIQLYEQNIIPKFNDYYSFLKTFIYNKYYSRSIDDFGFRMWDILPLRNKLVDNVLNLDKSRFLYKNELRDMINMPKEDGLDIFFMDGNQVPIGSDADNDLMIGEPLIDYSNNRGNDINNKSLKAVETFKPTEAMATAGARALEWRQKYGRGGTAVGVKRANQLVNRENLSLNTVKRMYSFFSRHGNYRSTHYEFRDGEPTTWRIAWDLWGGDAGRTWATNIWEKYKD